MEAVVRQLLRWNVIAQLLCRPGSPPGMPRWVKTGAITVGVLILLFVILRLTGIAGEHGPGRHMSGSAPQPANAATPAAS